MQLIATEQCNKRRGFIMPIIDVRGQVKKHEVMADTWGHLYPEPGSKHEGEIVFAIGAYGDEIIIFDDFKTLNDSPQKYELMHSVFCNKNKLALGVGVYILKCTLWFYKNSGDMYLNSRPLGRVCNRKLKKIY